MSKLFGVQFAPLFIPLERRLQTLGVLFAWFCFCIAGVVGPLILLYLCFTKYAFISLLYIAWIIYDKDTCRKGGRPSTWYRSLRIWDHYSNYFPVTMHKTADFDPDKNYIVGYHPHGIIAIGAFLGFGRLGGPFHKNFPKLRVVGATLNLNFYLPFGREFWLMSGAVSVDRESLDFMLSKNGTGNAVGIVVGGAAEALDAIPNTMELTLKNRKGFVKLAIRNGASLVPCIAFGENELFSQKRYPESSAVYKLQQTLKKILTFSTPFFYGRGVFQYTFGLLPYRHPLDIIVGKPIDTIKNPKPSQEEIDALHATYMKALEDLFEQHKEKYSKNPNIKLVFK